MDDPSLFRVDESSEFTAALTSAPDELLDVLIEVAYPLLRSSPTEGRGPLFRVTYSDGMFNLYLHSDRGGYGFIRYQVIEELRYVMLFELAWVSGTS